LRRILRRAKPIFKPIDIENTSRYNIAIEFLKYQYKGYSKKARGFGRFDFENFTETRDSLFFFNLDDVKSMKGEHLDSLKIKKKMVNIQNSCNGDEVVLIVIEDHEIDESNKELISYKKYHLRPKKSIKIDEFSDYGIYKPFVKKTTTNK